jgi:tRNA (cmo5U34)-methyltransferase
MWSENNSNTFIDYGRYFVPGRESQIEILCALIPRSEEPFTVWELGCGEGLLSEAILTRFPAATVVGWDGSERMLAQAAERLKRFGQRFRPARFSLVERDWRQTSVAIRAAVSSLVIHHLDDAGKADLYRDLYRLLEPGGILAIADLVQPAGDKALEIAAQAWDEAVRARALEMDGTTAAYDFFVSEKWNIYRYPDPMDMPSRLPDHIRWLDAAGFVEADVYWMTAGHAIYGGQKRFGR